MSLPATMQAARVLPGARPEAFEYTFQTVNVPQPGPGELLIKVVAAGLCHTDLTMPMAPHGGPLPLTGSHEPAGVIVGIGAEMEGARMERFKVGDRVMAVNNTRHCGSCPECKYHDARYCPDTAMIGLSRVDGAFANYCVVGARSAAIIPNGMSFAQAATFSCAGVTAYGCIKKANLKKGDVIGFSGLGAIGMLCMEMARCMGLRVVGLDARDRPIEAARQAKYSGDLLVNSAKVSVEEVIEQIRDLREAEYDRGDGVDAMVVLNTSPAAVPYALDLTRSHGLIIFTGAPDQVTIGPLDYIIRDITAVGTLNGTAGDLEKAAEMSVKYGIWSKVRPYDFDEESMRQMLRDVQGKEWSGKAVVRVDPELWD